MILLGEFNVDFMYADGFRKHKFIKILTNLNMTQLVNDSTRPLSKSCLGHIWCSHPERLRNVQRPGMSYHLPVYATSVYKRDKCGKNSHYFIDSTKRQGLRYTKIYFRS